MNHISHVIDVWSGATVKLVKRERGKTLQSWLWTWRQDNHGDCRSIV